MSAPVSRRPDPRARLRARVLPLALLALAPTAACYESQPLMGAPDPGAQVSATLNDRGRVALGESLGPAANVVEGRVVERTDTSMTLAVSYVRYFGRDDMAWKGERVVVPISAVRALQERRLSRSRSILTGVGLAAGLVALILTRSLAGNGGDRETGGSPPPQGS